MADNHRNQQLDRVLDSMLSQYSAAQPRPGLETRVLAQIAETRKREHAGSQNWHWWWLTGIATASLALVMAVLWTSTGAPWNPRKARPQAAIGVPITGTINTARAGLTDRDNLVRRKPRHKAFPRYSSVAQVRQEVFPSPAPLSSQEKLMLRYLADTPHKEVVAQSHPDDMLDQLASTDGSGASGREDMDSSLRNNQ